MQNSKNYYIKTNRIFTTLRKYGWLFTVLVAIGGLWEPKLGLLVIFIMTGLLISGFFTGRYWCGNICPHGSLFDRIIMPISLNKRIPKLVKSKGVIIAFFAFFMFNWMRKLIKISLFWGTYDFYDKLGTLFANTYLMVLIVGGGLALFVNSRTWCQFCPMGSLQKITHALGKVTGIAKKTEKKITISNQELCHSCGKCSRVCPFQLTPYLEFSDNNQFDNINCIKCGTCVENCPAGILSLSSEREAFTLQETTCINGYENREKITAQLTKVMDLDQDIKEYQFTFIDPQKVNYKPGQFILVRVQDEPKAYRAYSISSFNEDSTTISVIIKKVEKGYGTEKIFNEFQVGNTVILEGPMGEELVLDKFAEKVLFVSNGIGITPFIPLLKEAVINNSNLRSIILVTGQKYESQLLYHEYFKNYEREYKHFEYIPVVSRDKDSHVRKGHVTNLLKEMDLQGYKVYMCGTKNMIVDSINILVDQGVAIGDIFYESEEKIDVEKTVSCT